MGNLYSLIPLKQRRFPMHIARLVSRLFKLFIPSTIEEIAKSSGFMKRHSKLLPETFAKAMSLGLLDSKNITEEVIAEKCSVIQNGLSLSKQAISKRLNECTDFLQELLKKAFSLIYSNALEIHSSLLLNYFSDVKLLDATTISLPDQVADDYVGMGGRNAKSALKIQTLYSAVHHSITAFDITSGVTHDTNSLPVMIKELTENELFLADLGYFSIDSLRKIQEKNFFISRIKTNLKLYKVVSERYAIYEELDLKELFNQGSDTIDQDVYIGTESCNKLKVRLVGIKLSDEIAAQRIKKAKIQNNGANIDHYKRQLLHWNLMITNIKKETLDTLIITELYRVRWQIEILFKVLKSTLSIDKMHVGKTKYVEAILYGKLLGALLTMPLYDCVDQTILCKQGRGVSIQRFYTLLIADLHQFYTVKRITLHTYEEFSNLLQRIGKLSLHEKRSRQTTYSKIEHYLEQLIINGKT